MFILNKCWVVLREFADFKVKLLYKNVFLLLASLALIIPQPCINIADDKSKTDSSVQEVSSQIIASKSFSLDDRNPNKIVNNVFKDNILLTLNYLDERVKNKSEIEWSDIEQPRRYEFDLKPQETFAFHDQILENFNKSVVKTTNSHFNYQDGFKSSGYLFGDGVCHLASILNWAAKDAGLFIYTPTDHNFAKINEVPKEYGVSIFYMPDGFEKSARQNLYITNNLDAPVSFLFDYNGEILSIDIIKTKSPELCYLK